ncbi:MAG: hypothetical protein EXX96DRAFT_56146 [Benjaminiella poitrasii]|nr:MAG: hypothetical protein EXX96DRAFT_56146 [Benjaminiella poitrasii]
MSPYLYSTDTNYKKLDEKSLPSYSSNDDVKYSLDLETDEEDTKKTPIILPETTHSRFHEEYPSYPISSQYHNFRRQEFNKNSDRDLQFIPIQQKRWSCYKILTYFTLIFGVIFIVLAVVFKIESRMHISYSIQNQCPASCVTTCYLNIPFYQPSADCDTTKKSYCDMYCLAAGMKTANVYSILFIVSISIGSFLLAVRIIATCLRYCCVDYINSNKK